MRLYVILRYVAGVLLLNAFVLLISGIVSIVHSDNAVFPLLYSALVAALFGLFPILFIPPQDEINSREGLVIVVYSWLVSCVIGIVPYVLWGGEFTFTNAWFESVSGYTTTGSSILTDIEALPRGLLFWRSSTHFLGGIGIIILALAILPSVGISGLVLYRSETSPWALHEFRSNSRRSVQILFRVYIALTVIETLVLLACGMELFDAVTTAFATIATGGFSPKQASISSYGSVPVEITVILFMILSGIHFGLLFSAIQGKIGELWRSPVVKFYLVLLSSGTLLATVSLHGTNYDSWAEALRYGAFQIVSIGTSTGFATTDSAVWPPFAQFLLIFFTLQCACAGSTSGGIKVDRILVFIKATLRKLKEIKHPRAIISIKLGGAAVGEKFVTLSLLYISLYITIVFTSGVILTALGVDGIEAFTASAATMGNVGPGLGSVGSFGNFADLPDLGKWVLSFTMLLGRLEIYGLILCLMPGFWE